MNFEPLRARHAEELFGVLNDDELYEFIDEPPPRSVEALARRYKRLEAGRSPDGSSVWLNWVVREPRERLAIGFVQATVEDRKAHIGYVIGKNYWGKGLGTAAVCWLLARLDSMGLTKIVATVEVRNLRSIRLLEKLGFLRTSLRGTEIVFERSSDGRIDEAKHPAHKV